MCLVEVVDLRRTLCALRLVINSSLVAPPRDGAPSDRTPAYLRTVSASRKTRITSVHFTLRHEPLFLQVHHYRTSVTACACRMTGKPRPARTRVRTASCKPGEPLKIFCTKSAHCVYAQCGRHPPFTHRRGEPVTFFVVGRATEFDHHIAKHAVKRDEKWRVTPGFMGFLRRRASRLKKISTVREFEHACCITPHIASEASAGSGLFKGQ